MNRSIYEFMSILSFYCVLGENQRFSYGTLINGVLTHPIRSERNSTSIHGNSWSLLKVMSSWELVHNEVILVLRCPNAFLHICRDLLYFVAEHMWAPKRYYIIIWYHLMKIIARHPKTTYNRLIVIGDNVLMIQLKQLTTIPQRIYCN